MKTKTENIKAMRGEANENECCLNLKTKRGQWGVWSVEDLNGKQFNGFRGCRKPIWSIPLAGFVVVNAIDGDDVTFLCQVQ